MKSKKFENYKWFFIQNVTWNYESDMKIQISLMLFALFSIMLFVGSIDYVDALKAKGTGLAPKSFGKATASIVCGDKLCQAVGNPNPGNIGRAQ